MEPTMEFLADPSYQEMLSYLILFAIMVIAGLSPVIAAVLIALWRHR